MKGRYGKKNFMLGCIDSLIHGLMETKYLPMDNPIWKSREKYKWKIASRVFYSHPYSSCSIVNEPFYNGKLSPVQKLEQTCSKTSDLFKKLTLKTNVSLKTGFKVLR